MLSVIEPNPHNNSQQQHLKNINNNNPNNSCKTSTTTPKNATKSLTTQNKGTVFDKLVQTLSQDSTQLGDTREQTIKCLSKLDSFLIQQQLTTQDISLITFYVSIPNEIQSVMEICRIWTQSHDTKSSSSSSSPSKVKIAYVDKTKLGGQIATDKPNQVLVDMHIQYAQLD